MTKIEWTDTVWNPVRGCSRVSEGCRNCYAERMAARFSSHVEGAQVRADAFFGFARMTPAGPRWTGRVELVPDKLDEPLHWRKPRRVFVNSMSDLFHEMLRWEDIAAVFDRMQAAPRHTFQVLTKRAARMHEFMEWATENGLPVLPNVWLGVSCEDQKTANERIPVLLQTPAAVRFVSLEPLLGPIDLTQMALLSHVLDALRGEWCANRTGCLVDDKSDGSLNWVIVGGESGPGARPCEVAWIRSVVRQCREAGVPCFVKQDSGPRPGRQGRIPDELWVVKEYPHA